MILNVFSDFVWILVVQVLSRIVKETKAEKLEILRHNLDADKDISQIVSHATRFEKIDLKLSITEGFQLYEVIIDPRKLFKKFECGCDTIQKEITKFKKSYFNEINFESFHKLKITEHHKLYLYEASLKKPHQVIKLDIQNTIWGQKIMNSTNSCPQYSFYFNWDHGDWDHNVQKTYFSCSQYEKEINEAAQRNITYPDHYCILRSISDDGLLKYELYTFEKTDIPIQNFIKIIPDDIWHENVNLLIKFYPRFRYVYESRSISSNGIEKQTFYGIDFNDYLYHPSCSHLRHGGTTCSKDTVHQLDADSCEVHLFKNETEKAIQTCPREVVERENWNLKLDPYTYFPQLETISILCPEAIHNFTLKGVYIILLKPTCLLVHNRIMYSRNDSPKRLRNYEILKIADHLVKLLTQEEEDLIMRGPFEPNFPSKLLWNKVEFLKPLLELIKDDIKSENLQTKINAGLGFIVLLSLLFVTICIVILSLKLKTYFNKPDILPDCKMSDFSNDSI